MFISKKLWKKHKSNKMMFKLKCFIIWDRQVSCILQMWKIIERYFSITNQTSHC